MDMFLEPKEGETLPYNFEYAVLESFICLGRSDLHLLLFQLMLIKQNNQTLHGYLLMSWSCSYVFKAASWRLQDSKR